MQAGEVLELCRASGALLEGHFQLSSGLHSDRYFQCALLLSDPRRAGALAEALAPRTPPAELVVGPALGAVVWAHEMGRALGLPAFFTERLDGRMSLRRGFRIEPGTRVLVVEDVLTTGGSAREVIALLRELGAEPVGVAALVNRSGRANPFEDEDLPLACLAEAEVRTWPPEACPLCASGERGPALKPGSRPSAARA